MLIHSRCCSEPAGKGREVAIGNKEWMFHYWFYILERNTAKSCFFLNKSLKIHCSHLFKIFHYDFLASFRKSKVYFPRISENHYRRHLHLLIFKAVLKHLFLLSNFSKNEKKVLLIVLSLKEVVLFKRVWRSWSFLDCFELLYKKSSI